MNRYVASRPMFIDIEVMNMDARTVLGAEGEELEIHDIMKGLSSLYKSIKGKIFMSFKFLLVLVHRTCQKIYIVYMYKTYA